MTDIRINRKLAAILAADVVGYSRLMEADEAGTLGALKRHRETIFDPAVVAHNGRIVKLIGDGTIVEFGSVVDAVNCALAVQRSSASLPDASAREPTIVLRIGINLGDVIIEHNDIYGDGVNIAARLEYSCSGSPDMFVNGKTAIDGLSTLGAGSAASDCLVVTSVLPGCHFQTRIGRSMFLTLTSPPSWKRTSIRLPTLSWTIEETQTPPGSARGSPCAKRPDPAMHGHV